MGIREFNEKLAARITGAVGTMWAAYVFAGIAFISLPAAIMSGDPIVIVAWIAQTFLQLVLLAVIMVGQDVQAKGVQKKIDETHEASLAEFELAKADELATRIAALKARSATFAPTEQDVTNLGWEPGRIVDYGLGAMGQGATGVTGMSRGGPPEPRAGASNARWRRLRAHPPPGAVLP